MTITDLEFFLCDALGPGPAEAARPVLVRLSTAARLEGWGEACLPWRRDELPGRRDALLPVLAGRSVFEIEDLLGLAALRAAPLRCAIEMACWDLIGRIAGQPLCHLFGGNYRQLIPLAVRLGKASAAESAQMARELADQGYHCQIVTSLGRVEDDLELVAAIRQLTQDRAELIFDVAAQYDMEAARDLCAGLDGAGLEYVLDPLSTRDLDQVASLRRQTSVPLAVGRNVRGPADALAVIRCGAASWIEVDLQRVGGLASARKCAAVAQAAGLGACLAAGPSVGVALAAALHLAASTPAFSHCNQSPWQAACDEALVEPLEPVDGMLAAPQGPGLGVQVDRTSLDR